MIVELSICNRKVAQNACLFSFNSWVHRPAIKYSCTFDDPWPPSKGETCCQWSSTRVGGRDTPCRALHDSRMDEQWDALCINTDKVATTTYHAKGVSPNCVVLLMYKLHVKYYGHQNQSSSSQTKLKQFVYGHTDDGVQMAVLSVASIRNLTVNFKWQNYSIN